MSIGKIKRILRHLRLLPSYVKYTSWAWYPDAGLKAKRYPHQGAVLILSLPRSGSSWVGETLGKAESVSYLREPITQTLLKNRTRYSDNQRYITTVFRLIPSDFMRLFYNIFNGVPRFRPGIIINPSQWSLHERYLKKVVIKEVNPLAFGRVLEEFDPKVVFLIRHPAAVASSFIRLGWFDGKDWFEFGKRQASIIKETIESLNKQAEFLLVTYEDVASEPLSSFERICNFTGIPFDESIRSHIKSSTISNGNSDPYDTRRDSKGMIEVWKDRLKASEINSLMEGFHSEGLGFYKD